MATPDFDHTHPKIIETTFNLPEFAPACKKTNSRLHQLNLEIQSNLEFCDQAGHTHLLLSPPHYFFDQLLIYVNLCQIFQ